MPALLLAVACLRAAAAAFACPARFADTSAAPIPNVVHQPWLGGGTMRWEHVLAMMSVRYILRPDAYLLYYDRFPPASPTWLCALAMADKLVRRAPRNRTFFDGARVRRVEHQSDHMRLELLEEHGGMYIDHDAFVLRPLDDVRQCGAGLIGGYENASGVEKLNNGVLLGREGAPIFALWRRAYARGFKPSEWDRTSCDVPLQLARAHPDLALPAPEIAISPFPDAAVMERSGMSYSRALEQSLVVHLTGIFGQERYRQAHEHGLLRTIAERVIGAAGGLPGSGARRWSGSAAEMGVEAVAPVTAGLVLSLTERACLEQVRAYVQKQWRRRRRRR